MAKTTAYTFGSAMVDIIAVLASDSIEKISLSNAHSQFLLVEPGRKVEAESITTHIGGGALNTAVCLSRLGLSVTPVVKTGDDPSRHHVITHCDENGLDTDKLLTTNKVATGSAVMIASHENNAAIFTHRGANTTLNDGDLKSVGNFTADLVHASSLSGQSASMLPRIAELAKQSGAFFSSNPGIRQISNKANTVLAAARYMTLISLNQDEAVALAPCLSALDNTLDWGEARPAMPVLASPGGPIALEKFCQALASHGPEFVLITHGRDGAWLYDGNRLVHQDVVPAKVAGTAGAGDAFVSTLAFGLQSGWGAKKSLIHAAHNASSVVSHVDTTTGLLTLRQLRRRITAG